MVRKKLRLFFTGVVSTLAFSAVTHAANVWEVNSKGDITLNGETFRVKGGSWFGLEGRSELPSDEQNPSGAPMEMYMGNVFWNSSNRTLDSDAKEIKSLGFNSIRMPVVPQTLDDSDPQGKGKVLKNTESVRIEGAYSALKAVVKACSDAGLYVLLDMHACSNYIGWRAGRLDARPPYTDASRENYEHKREDCSCASTGNPSTVTRIQEYNETKWLADLKQLAGLGKEIGVDNIMGIDIYNEPWDYSWEEWRTMIDKAYEAISSVNPNILIFAQGIGGSHGNQDGTPETKEDTPHGDPTTNPNWGENLYEVRFNPPSMPKSKLVFSPHCYGPSVCTQPMFADLDAQPECAGLVEDEFGNQKCQVVIDIDKLIPGWHEHFGYLKRNGYAICIGEYGGNMDWPKKSEKRHQTRYSYLTNQNSDEQWQNAFVEYLMREGIYDSFYWSINPESSDTYGIFTSPFDPISNPSGWGTWSSVDTRKTALLDKLWNAKAIDNPGHAHIVNKKVVTNTNAFNCRFLSNGTLTYTLPEAQRVTVKLYGINGRLHSVVLNAPQVAGSHSITQSQMPTVAAGSYVAVLKAGKHTHKQKICITNQ